MNKPKPSRKRTLEGLTFFLFWTHALLIEWEVIRGTASRHSQFPAEFLKAGREGWSHKQSCPGLSWHTSSSCHWKWVHQSPVWLVPPHHSPLPQTVVTWASTWACVTCFSASLLVSCHLASGWQQQEPSQSFWDSWTHLSNSLCICCSLCLGISFHPLCRVKTHSCLRFWHKCNFPKEGFPNTSLLLTPFMVPLLCTTPMT